MRERDIRKMSLGGLINTTALMHVVNNADVIIWKRDLTLDTIATGSMICRCRIHPDAPIWGALLRRFNHETPEYGKAIRSVAKRKRYECAPDGGSSLAQTIDIMADADVDTYDTHITVSRDDQIDVHVYFAQGRDEDAYIYIDQRYQTLLWDDFCNPRILALKVKNSSPLLFVGEQDEFLIVLPINMNKPAFLEAERRVV